MNTTIDRKITSKRSRNVSEQKRLDKQINYSFESLMKQFNAAEDRKVARA